MSLPNEAFVKTALEVTGHFEDAADPFGGVSGDFDGMGISLGVLQWNIGSGSLQPLVKAAGQTAVNHAMPTHGGELWQACHSTLSNGLAIVRRWQNGSTLLRPIRAEPKAFTRSQPFVDQQIQAAQTVARNAWAEASQWATAAGTGQPTLLEFCWFFDVLTQNGGLKGVTFASVRDFINQAGEEKADDLICDWLESRPPSNNLNIVKDGLKNAALWRNAVPADSLALFVASYLRAKKSRSQWQVDVLNRKATIAIKQGWVHGERQDLTELIGG